MTTKIDNALKRVEEFIEGVQAHLSERVRVNSDPPDCFYISLEEFTDIALLKDEVVRLQEIERKYCQLIMTVGNKHPNETRHETALRYIKQAEMVSNKATQQVK